MMRCKTDSYGLPRVCVEGYYILPRVFLFFQTPSSEVTQPNATKRCHVFGSEQDLKIVVKHLGVLSSKTSDPKMPFRVVLRRHYKRECIRIELRYRQIGQINCERFHTLSPNLVNFGAQRNLESDLILGAQRAKANCMHDAWRAGGGEGATIRLQLSHVAVCLVYSYYSACMR